MPKNTKTDDTPAGKMGIDPRDPWYGEINRAAKAGRSSGILSSRAIKKVLDRKAAGDKAPGGKERGFGRKVWDTVKSIPRHAVMTRSKGRPPQVANSTIESIEQNRQRQGYLDGKPKDKGKTFKNPPVPPSAAREDYRARQRNAR